MTKAAVKKRIAIVFLILICIQYIPIEGYGVSNIKFAALCMSPFIWIKNFKTISKALVWGGIYLIAILFSVLYNMDSFRLSTIGYKIALITMFIMFYDLIYFNRALKLDDFIKFLKTLILAYSVCLVFQQLAIIVGIRSFPIINLMYYLNRGIGANSLALEPSHAARILTVLMLVLLRMHEVKWGRANLTFFRLYKGNKWVILGFLWCMLTMGSGTAFIGLAILSLYFIKKKYLFGTSVVLIVVYFIIPFINYEPLNRAKNTFKASLTLNQKEVIEVDNSGAGRIVPFLNTINLLEINKTETWLGKGIDTNVSAEHLSDEQTIGGITDYGLICFILSLIFVFVCCVKKIWSLESLIFMIMLGLTIGNIAYTWGILMLFATSKYFTTNKRFYQQSINFKTTKVI